MSAGRLTPVVPAILVGAPVALLVAFIVRFAVNVPAGDGWHLAQDLHATYHGQARLSDLWRLHNEHRMLFPRVALIGLAFATGWNAVAEMYASAALLLVMAIGWWLLHRDTGCRGLWTFVPLAWLVLSIGQWENLLTGWQLQFCIGAAALFWAIYLLGRPSMSAFGGGALCAIVASYSFNNGLVVWPAGLVTLWLRGESPGRLIRWAIGGVLVAAIYYAGYAPAAHHPSPFEAFANPLETVSFFVMNVGAPLAGGSMGFAAGCGVLVLVLLVAWLLQLWPHRRQLLPVSGATASLVGLLAASLATSLAIAVGRVGFHRPEWAISSRYLTMTSLGVASLYLLYLMKPTPRGWVDLRSMLLAMMVVGQAGSIGWGFEAGSELRATRLKYKYAAQTFLRQPEDAFASTIDAAIIREYGPFLQGQGWSVFRDPVSFVRLASTDNGVPLGEILPERPVVQEITCPVSTLTDLQILFATYKRANTSTVRIALADHRRPILERSVLGTALQDNGWLELPVTPPVEQCAGRDLVLTISSPDARPGNAVTVWTYPRYYKARLVSPREPAYSGRVIGLVINREGS